MQSNIPRAAIHVGKDKKSFSAQVGNEAERRGWDENVYRLKNADKDKNNHYNFSRKNLNFEIVRGGKFVPLGSNPIPLLIAFRCVLMNWTSNHTWMPGIPTKYQRTVRTALSA